MESRRSWLTRSTSGPLIDAWSWFCVPARTESGSEMLFPPTPQHSRTRRCNRPSPSGARFAGFLRRWRLSAKAFDRGGEA